MINHQKAFPAEAEASRMVVPMRRFGDIHGDGGRIAGFVAGPDSSFLTGMTLQVDGGLFMHP